jgi:hypothetical protein
VWTPANRLYELFPDQRYHIRMLTRLAWVLLTAAGLMSSAGAADLIEVTPTVCDCGSNMITIYDFEPGVVTRHWSTDCECRYLPSARKFPMGVASVGLPDSEALVDTWRRW